MLAPHYARAEHEARALLREAFTLPGDIHVDGDRLHGDLDPQPRPDAAEPAPRCANN